MIVTVTPNAALDVTYVVDHLAPGETHRVRAVHYRAGGKGINVARVLHALGREVVATGFVGGPTGATIQDELGRAGLPGAFAQIEGESRRTIAVVAAGMAEATLFNEPGPPVRPDDWEQLADRVGALSTADGVVVLAGSLPSGARPDAYARLIDAAHAVGARVILDADGDALRAGLPSHPDLVKPNVAELGRVLGTPIDAGDDAAVWRGAVRLRQSGAASVVVSRGAAGLLCCTAESGWTARLHTAVVGNPTGAGDAAVAALAVAMADRLPWPEALRHATALSAAVVAAPVAGEFDTAAYADHLAEVAVTELDALAR